MDNQNQKIKEEQTSQVQASDNKKSDVLDVARNIAKSNIKNRDK